jgi:hypothetical protein
MGEKKSEEGKTVIKDHSSFAARMAKVRRLRVTPGEWHVDPSTDLPGHYVLDLAVEEQEAAFESSDEKFLEEVFDHDSANAQLMRAAPRMVKTLAEIAQAANKAATEGGRVRILKGVLRAIRDKATEACVAGTLT